MGDAQLPQVLLELIGDRFKALAEPVRLQILNALQEGEKTVSELVQITSPGQANVSKHLRMLHGLGSWNVGRPGCTCTTRSRTKTCSAFATSCAAG